MEFPKDFSKQARANVMAVEIKARRAVTGPGSIIWKTIPGIVEHTETALVFQYIMSVFAAYAHECCELGRSGDWSADIVDREAREGLRLIALRARTTFDPDEFHLPEMSSRRDGSFPAKIQGVLESAPEWTHYQDALLEVIGLQSKARTPSVMQAHSATPNPWFIWESSRDLPTALSSRLHAACKSFQEQTKMKIFENKDLWRKVEVPLGRATLSHGEPNPQAMLASFSILFKWFLGELSEAWTEHLVQRVGLRGKDAIEAFEEHARNFAVQAIEHNWKWGIAYLRLGSVEPTLSMTLAGDVIAQKVRELRSLSPSKPTLDKPKRFRSRNAQFPARAAWLRERLTERGWDHNDPPRHNGPDRKTVLKILAGGDVREDVLEKLAKALSQKRAKVDLLDIPRT